MTITSIIFDLDDTLLIEFESAKEAFLSSCKLIHKKYGIPLDKLYQTVRIKSHELWYKSPAREYCLNVGVSSWEGMWAKFIGKSRELKRLQEWAPFYRNESWNRTLKNYNIEDNAFALQLAEIFQHERRNRHIICADVEPTLEKLKKKYKLALLTNGLPGLQREKLHGSKIEQYFDVIIISGDYGFKKPDPKIFSIILNKLNTSSEKCIMVGNSLNSGIYGANNAGIKSIWLNRGEMERNNKIISDFEISMLSQIY